MHDGKSQAAATEYLYAFRAGRFYQPCVDTLGHIALNKQRVISEILNLPIDNRTNHGALRREGSFRKRYRSVELIQSLSLRSWRYSGFDDHAKERLIRRIESINCRKLLRVISEFIRESLEASVANKISLCVYGGYLWNERPGDLDVIAIIEDPSISIIEIGGWLTEQAKIFSNNKAIRIDVSVISAGAINSKTRNHDLFNVLGWYSGGGVTIYGTQPLSIPIPDFIAAYLPLVTVGFCFKELMKSGGKFEFLAHRLNECWEIIRWLNTFYPSQRLYGAKVRSSVDNLNHTQAVSLLLEQSSSIKNCVAEIAVKIKEKALKSLDIIA